LRNIVRIVGIAQKQVGKSKYCLLVVLDQQIISYCITFPGTNDKVSVAHERLSEQLLFNSYTAPPGLVPF
jgi:hypothetical protein